MKEERQSGWMNGTKRETKRKQKNKRKKVSKKDRENKRTIGRKEKGGGGIETKREVRKER